MTRTYWKRTTVLQFSRPSTCLAFAVVILLKVFLVHAAPLAQAVGPPSAVELVNQMVQAESTAWKNRQHFSYRKEERSNRTKGHLWSELVVETSNGPLERLIAVDGKPLSDIEDKAEDRRIDHLAKHPDEFRRQTQRRNEDEARLPSLMSELTNLLVFHRSGFQGDLIEITFQPNPSFRERTYQDRVVHAMSGVLLIHRTDMRLSELDVRLEHRVEFGYGILGDISDTTNFSLARQEVSPGSWEPTKIHVHLDGTVLLMKSLSREIEASQYDFRLLPHNLTVAEAARMLRSKQ